MRVTKCSVFAVMLFTGVEPVLGSLIFVGPMDFGNALTPSLLTIQNLGIASGCAGIFGGEDITGLAACPGGFTGAGGNEVLEATGTFTIGELESAGIDNASNLVLVFNSGEPNGTRLSIQDLALVFFDVSGGSSFTVNLPGTPLALTSLRPSSFAFRLDPLQSGLANDFFSDTNNRVGGAATISGSTGSVNSFSFAAIPEPSVIWQVASGLLLVGLWTAKRRNTRISKILIWKIHRKEL